VVRKKGRLPAQKKGRRSNSAANPTVARTTMRGERIETGERVFGKGRLVFWLHVTKKGNNYLGITRVMEKRFFHGIKRNLKSSDAVGMDGGMGRRPGSGVLGLVLAWREGNMIAREHRDVTSGLM